MNSLCVATIGETMAVFRGEPVNTAKPAADSTYRLGIGGAESNVAMTVSSLGHSAAWVSAVGDDPFGRLILQEVAAAGVDVSAVRVDSDRPTGMYVKTPNFLGSDVRYYRNGSAASQLDRRALSAVRGAEFVHLSGISLALGPSVADLVEAVVIERQTDSVVSFDVNHRPALWGQRDAGEALLRIARHADIVFVGRDEAELVWGTSGAKSIRRLLPEVPTLVIKDAEQGATTFEGESCWEVPSPHVNVVEAVGAGDAFAAGWLSSRKRRYSPRRCLAVGHAVAERALLSAGDLAEMPPPHIIDARAEQLLMI